MEIVGVGTDIVECLRVGRMIAYQEYNTRSPLNGLAARWAAEHPQFLPIDPREIAPPLVAKSEIAATETVKPEAVEAATIDPSPTGDPWAAKIVIS